MPNHRPSRRLPGPTAVCLFLAISMASCAQPTPRTAPPSPFAIARSAPPSPFAVTRNAPPSPFAVTRNAPPSPFAVTRNAPPSPFGITRNVPAAPSAFTRAAPASDLFDALSAPPEAPRPAGSYSFFDAPPPGDPWTYRISRWQLRQRSAERAGLIPPFPPLPPPVASEPPTVASQPPRSGNAAQPSSLSARYEGFMRARRRAIAEQVLRWVQAEAETRFVEDGPVDHWPTLPEVLAAEGDDCDGLELLAYHALREMGFRPERVYRAILHRPGFGQHHMVTLWFEDRDDPWVLDPTATITTRFLKLSELSGWVPLKVFSENREFTVTAR